jgi:SAM-dependent methyltransferase
MPDLHDVVNFWDNRPCNIRHSKSELGSAKYFKEVSQRRFYVEPHIKEFAKFEEWKGKRVLEIGCGIGTDGFEFASNGAIYTGTDISTASLELAKKRFELSGIEARLIPGNAENLSSLFDKKEEFDLVYSFGVLHHTPSIQNALREIVKLSNETTAIKIMLYAKESWKQALINDGLEQPEAQYGCPIANSYTHSEVQSLFEEAGLEVVDITQDHIFPFVVADYIEHRYKLQPYFETMPKEVFASIKRHFGWHLLIDARLSTKHG